MLTRIHSGSVLSSTLLVHVGNLHHGEMKFWYLYPTVVIDISIVRPRNKLDVSRDKELERSVASVAVAFGLRVSGLPEDITRFRMGYNGRLFHNGDSCHYFDASYCQEYLIKHVSDEFLLTLHMLS